MDDSTRWPVTERFGDLSPDGFGEELKRLEAAENTLVTTIREQVAQGFVPPIVGIKLISEVKATLYGFDELHVAAPYAAFMGAR